MVLVHMEERMYFILPILIFYTFVSLYKIM